MFANFVNADKADRRAAGAKDIAPDLPTPQQVKVSNLCKESLVQKWFAGSPFTVMNSCPFCHDARDSGQRCASCVCPPEICGNGGDSGIVNDLVNKYDHNVHICDIDEEDLDSVIALFNKYIIVEADPKV